VIDGGSYLDAGELTQPFFWKALSLEARRISGRISGPYVASHS
jgi:hypothetical protein